MEVHALRSFYIAGPALADQPPTLCLGFVERAGFQDEALAVRELAVVQTSAFPAVALAVKPGLAIDLPAVLAECPHVIATWR